MFHNFIVGLTNVSPNISTPTLYNYTVCGQYPGAVRNGTTVSLYCQVKLPPFRYVVVQIPMRGHFVLCELEVLVRGTIMSNILILATICYIASQAFQAGFYPDTFWGNFPQTSEIPPSKNFWPSQQHHQKSSDCTCSDQTLCSHSSAGLRLIPV